MVNFGAFVRIVSVLANNKIEDETPCVPEIVSVTKCISDKGNGICFSCILDVVAGEVQDNMTFPDLLASNFCGELHKCKTQKCDAGCGSEWSTLYQCAEEWGEKYAEDAQICPGIEKSASTDSNKAISSAPNNAPILVHDFVLPFNYTNSGIENMATC